MMFRVDVGALSAAAKWAARALPSRPALPILKGMLIEAGQDEVTLSAYDSLLGASVQVPALTSTPGRIVLPGALLIGVLGSLPKGGEVEFEMEEGQARATVRAGGVEFQLLAMPTEDYPHIPDLPPACGEMSGEDFRSAVDAVSYAVSATAESGGLRIDGVRIEVAEGLVTFVATDRYRVPSATREFRPRTPGLEGAVIVSPSALAAFAEAADGPVDISLPGGDGPGMMGFSCGGRRVVTALFSGKYPAWRRVIPSAAPLTAEVDAKTFREALRRSQLVLAPKAPVRLTLMEGRVRVDSGDESTMVEVVSADVRGEEEMVCHFNPAYLIQALEGSPGARAVLHLNWGKPALVTAPGGGSEYQHVVMPQRCA